MRVAMKKDVFYHLIAIITVFFWGCAGAATKTLLKGMTSIHILFLKYLIAYIVFVLLCPKPIKTKSKKEELLFFLCGFSGMTVCYFFENTAFVYTGSAVVTVMFNLSPIFVAFFMLLTGKKKVGPLFFIGCAICFFGAWLVAFNGLFIKDASIKGVLLALGAGISWAVYVILAEGLGDGYELKGKMRRLFFYAVITEIPLVLFEHKGFSISFALQPINLLSLIVTGVLIGALGYLMWNASIDHLGGDKTNLYIYLLPLFTMLVSAVTIHEKIGILQCIGAVLTIVGVVLSQRG